MNATIHYKINANTWLILGRYHTKNGGWDYFYPHLKKQSWYNEFVKKFQTPYEMKCNQVSKTYFYDGKYQYEPQLPF